jgi:hypothetical protein
VQNQSNILNKGKLSLNRSGLYTVPWVLGQRCHQVLADWC